MSVHEFEFKRPPVDIARVDGERAERVGKLLKSKRLRLGDNQHADLEKEIGRRYERWHTQSRELRQRTVRLNELLEGVVEETNFPFEGASNVTLRYAAGMARTFRSVFNRTVYNDRDLFSIDVDSPPEDSSVLQRVEAVGNKSFNTDSNGLDTLEAGTIPCFRDGTLVISGSWDRRVEKVWDSRTYTDSGAFQTDYPSAEDAGVGEDVYNKALDAFLADSAPEIIVEFDHDQVEHDGPEYEIVPLARFCYYPLYAQSVARMEMYGRLYSLSSQEFKLRVKRKKYYEAQAKRITERGNTNGVNEWDRSKNFIEGLATRGDDAPLELLDFVIKYDMDGDGIPEKYMGTYSVEHKVLLIVYRYELKRNVDVCVAFRFMAREDRFLGASLLGDADDLFNLMDTIHRHRNNVRMLTTSPVLLAQDTYKEQIDLSRGEHVFKPGLTFWVKDPNTAVKQLVLQNLDQPGNSLDEENLIVRYIELLIGPTQALSGRESPSDPRSPMGKTLALLNQSNQRIDDYIDEFKRGLAPLMALHMALHEQYGPLDGLAQAMGQDLAKLRWKVRRRSVTMSPEFAMQRLSGLLQTYSALFQLIQAGDPVAVELWHRQLVASGEPDRDKLMVRAKAGPGQGLGPGISNLIASMSGGNNGAG